MSGSKAKERSGPAILTCHSSSPGSVTVLYQLRQHYPLLVNICISNMVERRSTYKNVLKSNVIVSSILIICRLIHTFYEIQIISFKSV